MSGVYMDRLRDLAERGILKLDTVGRVNVDHEDHCVAVAVGSGPCTCNPDMVIQAKNEIGVWKLWRVWCDPQATTQIEPYTGKMPESFMTPIPPGLISF